MLYLQTTEKLEVMSQLSYNYVCLLEAQVFSVHKRNFPATMQVLYVTKYLIY